MANEEIILQGMGVVEARTRIRGIFEDVYGSDDVKDMMFDNHPLIKSISYGDSVEIYSRQGDAVVDISEAGATIESRVKSLTMDGEPVADTGNGGSSKDMFGGEAMQDIGNGVTVFDDGSIRFKPQFSKSEAKYIHPTSAEHSGGHEKCRSCAHFIEGGGCHIVQGDIDKEGYCEEFYADVGVYGHEHEGYVENNLTIWGLDFDWEEDDLLSFLEKVEDKLQEEIGL